MPSFKELMDRLKDRGMPEKPTSPDEAFLPADEEDEKKDKLQEVAPVRPKGPKLNPAGVKSLKNAFK